METLTVSSSSTKELHRKIHLSIFESYLNHSIDQLLHLLNQFDLKEQNFILTFERKFKFFQKKLEEKLDSYYFGTNFKLPENKLTDKNIDKNQPIIHEHKNLEQELNLILSTYRKNLYSEFESFYFSLDSKIQQEEVLSYNLNLILILFYLGNYIRVSIDYGKISSILEITLTSLFEISNNIQKQGKTKFQSQNRKDFLDLVLTLLSQLYAGGFLSFPWKRQTYTNKKEIITNLKNHQILTSEESCFPFGIKFLSRDTKGKPLFPLKSFLTFISSEEDYQQVDVLVDLFQEKARLSAIRADSNLCVLDHWSDPFFVKEILKQTLDFYQQIEPHSLRETIYANARECTQFKPSLVKGIINTFQARRILDFSAGWGDRLAGAISADVQRYTAYDPNLDLLHGHSEIIKELASSKNWSKYNINYSGFEEAILPNNITYDLVFTSPPFFDFEIYSSAQTQSVAKFPQLDDWILGFLFVSLWKSWNVLEPFGHLIIHLSDTLKIQVCEKMCLLATWLLKGIQYRGVICSIGGADKPRPLWVFQKGKDDNLEMKVQAEAELKRLYYPIWKSASEMIKSLK